MDELKKMNDSFLTLLEYLLISVVEILVTKKAPTTNNDFQNSG